MNLFCELGFSVSGAIKGRALETDHLNDDQVYRPGAEKYPEAFGNNVIRRYDRDESYSLWSARNA
jgi:hypothetical protein